MTSIWGNGGVSTPILPTTAQVVTTIAGLRAISKTLYSRAIVLGYYTPGDGGGGVYYYDSTDLASADNGGTIIVAADLGRWKLCLINVLSVKQFGAKGDGVTDDTTAIQNAINSFGSGSPGTLSFPTASYKISSIISNNRSLVFDGNNSILTISNAGQYGVILNGTNCAIRNLQLNKFAGSTPLAALYATGLQHVIDNLTSRDQIWGNPFILAQDLKESHLTHLRVDSDVAAKTGIIVQLDYCVNNTISHSMLGYCSQAIFGSSTPHPTLGYHTEGILISDNIITYANKGINVDNGTFISVNNNVLDFCETQGIFISNGQDCFINNNWIASNLTNGFIGVGSLVGVDGMKVCDNVFVRGAAAIAGTVGVSLSGPNASVIGNTFKSGMNGGTVTQASSQVIGNTIEAPGTDITAASAIAIIHGALSINGNKGIFPSALSGAATIGASGAPPAQVAGYAVINLGGTNFKVPYYNN